MNYQCFLDNNYEVINFCNINKFNEKIKKFSGKSWAQIIMPEKISLPNNKPNIKVITDFYLNININSSKIINLPYSNNPNIEGLALTGKALLVHGEIQQNIIYISDTLNNSKHSIKSNIHFNTYIVIDKNSETNPDTYCIYPYIENLSILSLGKKSFIKNITLFLFAHKINNQIEKLPNKIIIKSKDNKEVASIEFNKSTKEFIINSTGNIPDKNLSKPYIVFNLKNSLGSDKFKIILNSDENADSFKNNLNTKFFDYGDKLVLLYADKSKVEISNFPNNSQTYTPNLSSDIFEISNTGLINSSLNSNILIINDDNQEVASIQFIDIKNSYLTISNHTGLLSTNLIENTNEYAVSLLLSKNTLISKGIIFGKMNGEVFSQNLNNKTLMPTSNTLRIESRFPNRVIIKNYKGETQYKIKGEPEFLKITKDGLIAESLNYNTIRLKNINNTYVLFIYFSLINNLIFVHSTGIINFSSNNFSVSIVNKYTASIKKNQTGANIKSILDIKNFNVGDILHLEYSKTTLVEITDLPNKDNIFNPLNNKQSFKITETGLIPYILENEIIINNDNNKLILIIKFDILDKKFLITSTGEFSPSTGGINYFKMTLYNSDKITEKIGASISDNSNGNEFENIFINQKFEFEDIIKLECAENNNVIITNFPNSNNYYNLKNPEEWFKISKNGLKIINLSKVLISFKNDDNDDILNIKFDSFFKRLVVSSTDSKSHTDLENEEYFSLTLKFSNETIKIKSSIKGNETATIFALTLNNYPFEYGDIIDLTYRERDRVILYNYPTEGETFSPFLEEDRFIITEDALEPQYRFLDSLITFLGNEDAIISKLRFNITLKTLSVGSSKNIANISFGDDDYFSLSLKSSDGVLKTKSSVKGVEAAIAFKQTLNNKSFEYGDRVHLKFKEHNRVLISTYSDETEFFNPFLGEDIFTITENGLIQTYKFLESIIYFKGITNNFISSIRFNTDLNILSVGTSKNIANSNWGFQEYFSFLLINSENNKIIVHSSIKANETTEKFSTILNDKNFSFNDIIVLYYKDSNKILISNLTTNINYKTQAFKILKHGLKSITPPPSITLPSDFVLMNSSNEEMLRIEFDIVNKKLIVLATDAIEISQPSSHILLTFQVSNIDSRDFKFGENPKIFASQINNLSFNFGDKLFISYFNQLNHLFKITNYPNKGDTFVFPPPNTGFVKFKINFSGLSRIN